MERFILDSSLVAKWYFDENLKDRALSFYERLRKKEIRVIVPETFFIEMASICWKKVGQRTIKANAALDTFDLILGLPLERHRHEDLWDVALENSFRFGISVYDSLYVALSEVYVSPFVTADRALYQKCRKRFDFIEYLGDWEL